MAQGYPDFQRVSRYGGYELASAAGTYADGSTVWSGFAGSWPYLFLIIATHTGSPYVQLAVDYYADAAFLTFTGRQYVVRGPNQATSSQYAVLGPWCKIVVSTSTTGTVQFNTFNVYGTYGGAGAGRIAGAATPLYASASSVSAAGTRSDLVTPVSTGAAVLSVFSASALWTVAVKYYDFASAGFVTYWEANYNLDATGGTWRVPALDAPLRVDTVNAATGAHTIGVYWIQEGY